MDGSQTTQGARSLIQKLFLLVFTLSVLSFGLFVIRQAFPGFLSGSTEAQTSNVWLPYVFEKAMYTRDGYQLGWLYDFPVLNAIRSYLDPYFAFWDVVLMRTWGLMHTFPLFVIAAMAGVFEGRVKYNEKVEAFGNISSTWYHISMRLFTLVLSLCCCFVFFPFGETYGGVTIPLVINTSWFGTLWVSNPFNVVTVLGPVMAYVAHLWASNLDRNI
ncbi:MAG: DUF4400 domain-containing protein [Proteobacteria bacterium]|nr:DUF4400 domain-containing protein [Pseudomonadota bacterium]